MNPLIHFLIATTLIVGLILLRMFAERSALRKKLRRGHADGECQQVSCWRGCETGQATPDLHSVSRQNTSRRTANHAP